MYVCLLWVYLSTSLFNRELIKSKALNCVCVWRQGIRLDSCILCLFNLDDRMDGFAKPFATAKLFVLDKNCNANTNSLEL